MSFTTTILMSDEKRGDSPRKTIKLPAIAPKDDYSSSASSSRSGRVSGPAVPPRARLPPRSRTGCWTCRTRKVKCDEGRPICGQCSRLGHTCDYSPRLSFRDDTPRVVERMQDVTVAGSIVWDSHSQSAIRRRQSTDASIAVASPTPSSAGSAIADDMPPFASLLTDEERERKAEASSPGTYQVVVNPRSFQHLPEYNDGIEIKRERQSFLRRPSIATSLASSIGRESMVEAIAIPGDPNTVVLPRFEDLSRKTTRELKSPVSPVAQHTQIKIEEPEVPKSLTSEDDIRSLAHFRRTIWKQLAPAEPETSSSVVLLDKIAGEFPPLSHAMKAVAFQSMMQRDGRETLEGLQNYTQALQDLQHYLRNKSEEEFASDGVFLTHFLMLVYEIATADLEHSEIRTHHLHMLQKIAIQRRNTFHREQFPFVIWWICTIDLDSIFSGIGGGDFVSSMLESDSVPPPGYHLYPLGSDGLSIIYAEERDTLPTILSLAYEVTRLATRMAVLAREFRSDRNFRSMDPRQRDMTVRHWQGRIYEYQEALRQLWITPPVLALLQHTLPFRSQRIYEHAFTLYRACIIYSHTSMWPAQRMDTSPDFDDELAFAANEIVQVASSLLSGGHSECRFLIFPLFMAGFASLDGGQKMIALNLIEQMEQDSLGRNTLAVRRALGIVYEKQNDRFMNHGHSLDVDWMDIMIEQGLTVVNFGF